MAEQPNVQPRFEVEHITDQTVTVRKLRYVSKEVEISGKARVVRSREEYEEEEPFGYMAYFPLGHSIRIRTMEELRRLGLHKQPGLVDMDTGHVITEDSEKLSLKELVARKTTPPQRRSARVG
jgi:hypothetical protein